MAAVIAALLTGGAVPAAHAEEQPYIDAAPETDDLRPDALPEPYSVGDAVSAASIEELETSLGGAECTTANFLVEGGTTMCVQQTTESALEPQAAGPAWHADLTEAENEPSNAGIALNLYNAQLPIDEDGTNPPGPTSEQPTSAAPLAEPSAEALEASEPTTLADGSIASVFRPVTPPSYCASNRNVLGSRTEACVNMGWTVDLFKRTNGIVRHFGRASGTAKVYVYMSWNQLSVINQTTMRMTSTTGFTPSISGQFICGGACNNKKGTLSTRSLPLNVNVTAIGGVAPVISAGSRRDSILNWQFTFSTTGATPATLKATNLRGRCDNRYAGASGSGCVVPNIRPVLSYSLTGKYPSVARHINLAINSGLEGPATRPLTRTTNTTTISANRNRSCPSSLTRPSGYSCDEYPFASTLQGAASGGNARVFSNCQLSTVAGSGSTGFSRCMVPVTQNSGAGGVLSSFYSVNRVHDGDRFQVRITG